MSAGARRKVVLARVKLVPRDSRAKSARASRRDGETFKLMIFKVKFKKKEKEKVGVNPTFLFKGFLLR
ncbi:MAG: hypothetical protein COT90_00550 [Candidatus Diapherotrites archaeon CG10_big_fil_rev_8_21_14_0_10_31_34]|nr:MAG: hypothetical protein COT90_00550 [Candidatus Diapherotrites archaeon CG10_big_fil_rev_8_21_14_0_10_31_34]